MVLDPNWRERQGVPPINPPDPHPLRSGSWDGPHPNPLAFIGGQQAPSPQTIATPSLNQPGPPDMVAASQPVELQPLQSMSIASMAPTVRDFKGGFIGSGTDALADKNLQAAQAQSAAAQANIGRMETAANAERELRAAKLGISRGILDQMEGRAASGMPSISIGAPTFDPFARAGDGFGDSQLRAAQYDSMIKDVGSANVSNKQRAALIEGAQGLIAPGIAAMREGSGLAQHQMINQAGILKGMMDAQLADKELQANKAHWGQQDALARDQSIAQQQHWNQQLGLERDKNTSGIALAQERNQIARDAALNKARPLSEYDKTLQRAQAKQQADQTQHQKMMGGTLNESFMKFDRLNELTNISGLFGPALAAGSKLVSGDRAAKAEEFNALANNMILDVTERMKGALSDKDIQFVKENMPGLGNTPEGNRQIMNNLRSFLLQKAKATGMDMGQVINQRGETLANKGLSKDQIVEQLRQEFAGVH